MLEELQNRYIVCPTAGCISDWDITMTQNPSTVIPNEYTLLYQPEALTIKREDKNFPVSPWMTVDGSSIHPLHSKAINKYSKCAIGLL